MERRGFLVAAMAAVAGCSDEHRPPSTRRTGGTAPAPPVPAATPTGPADWNALGRGLRGRLIRPDDAAYDLARRLYVPRFDRIRPAGIAYCENPEDVAECLAFGARARVPVAVRSGGHGYAGWSSGTGLVVDVSPMDAVRAEGGAGGRAVVGAGARLIDLYDRLADERVGVPAGTCPTVGVAGLTLGGGLGVMSRAYGLTCDVLESVTVVTADGRVRVCDARRDPELFWACRGGGGGNFGVAVEFTFRTHEAAGLTTFTLRWPWSRAAEVIRGWQRWAPAAPDGIWSSLQINTAPSGGAPTVDVTGVARSDPDLGPLVAAVGRDPSGREERRLSYLEAMKVTGGCAGRTAAECHARGDLPGQRPEGRFPRTDYSGKSHLAYRPLRDGAIDELAGRFTRGNGVAGRSVLMDAMGGAIARVAPGDTAFPHRRALFCLQYLADGDDLGWLRATHRAMEPHLGGAAYVNYIDPDLRDWGRAYYGANLGRLARVKAAYDPRGLLRFPQGVTAV
ncbi:FAD-binding oxidoreductase [Actinomadura viridis]|uniref:FAD/FMN-containing dehydrogenase n=1 Tax=Actinomadura viridis TaxID=58110 RepID=A0A931DEP9_9ACTN|nr:FAD-binding oxidoreductase [Actinomadura viridis]MBG6087459.1 FAD/FMN-containing dehydrogenase [Actinomadura viridis]